MLKVMQYVTISILVLLACYIVMAFTNWELDPGQWVRANRAFVGFMSLLAAFCACIAWSIKND